MLKLRILNSSEHLPKDKLVTPYWFKWLNAHMLNVKFLRLKQREITALAYVLSVSSESKAATIEISPEHLTVFGRMGFEDFIAACEILSEFKLIEVISHISGDNLAEISPKYRGDFEAKEAGRIRREEKRRESAAEPAGSVDPHPSIPEVQEKLRYDHDDPSVNVPPEERPLPKLALLWNQHANEVFARVKMCSATRRKHCANRWKENPTDEFWADVIWKINASDFCLGRTKGDRAWKADFDWLVKPGTAEKVLEGKYDNRGPGGSPSTPKPKSYWARTQEEKQ